ncbi:MAG TPA: hypothetical protein PKI11_02650 [Candidatus Hydrogenedentes bacterium]|nr:hypothetical protein [Candidatus Hydrogenedentota bacterium]
MSDPYRSLESRLERVADEVRSLGARVDQLARRLDTPEATPPRHRESGNDPDLAPISLLGSPVSLAPTKLLTGTAFVCFILVIALSLRTVVDNAIVDKPLGTVFGLVYALCVLLHGYHRAARGRPFAVLSIVCAIVLVCSIVLEAHHRFGVFSSGTGYGILASALLLILGGALRYKTHLVLNFAVPSMTMVALAMDFPNPAFLPLAAFIAFVNGIAFVLARDRRTRSLCWSTFVITLFFWFFWAMKLRGLLPRQDAPPPELAALWFTPILIAFAVGHLVAVVAAVVHPAWPLGAYETALPILNAAYVYLIARLAVSPLGISAAGLGAACLLAAAIQLLMATSLAAAGEKGRRAASSMSTAVFLLLAVSLHPITGNSLWSLILWSLAAIAFAITLAKRLDPLVQGVACLFQAYLCAMSLHFGALSVGGAAPAMQILTLTALCALCTVHYAALRAGAAKNGNRTGRPVVHEVVVVVLVAAIVFGFGALRIALHMILPRLVADVYAPFQCGQSIIINFGALAIALIGLHRRSSELITVAALLAAAGAVKVFAFDLLNTQGLPLVLSVLVFGITTILGSFIWNRWQHRETSA